MKNTQRATEKIQTYPSLQEVKGSVWRREETEELLYQLEVPDQHLLPAPISNSCNHQDDEIVGFIIGVYEAFQICL